jgi:hypothetical protein
MPRKLTIEDADRDVELLYAPVPAPEDEQVVAAQEDHPEGWVLVRAAESLIGGGTFVPAGETYWQPPKAAKAMAKAGWVTIVK